VSVRLYPDPHLTRPCRQVAAVDPQVRALATEMADVMYAAQGRGLAAPQLGRAEVSMRLFVMDAGWKETGRRAPGAFLNPEIVWASDDSVVREEACLSIPDQPRRIARPARIRLRWIGLDGMAHETLLDGVEATIAQHERDHLDGILILDHPEVP